MITVKSWNGAKREARSAPEAVRKAIEMWEADPTYPGLPAVHFYVGGQHIRTVNNLPLLKRQLESYEAKRARKERDQ